MGVITIEIPQPLRKTFRVVSEESAAAFVEEIDALVQKANGSKKASILGLWSDREESAEDIARELRRKSNNRHLRDG